MRWDYKHDFHYYSAFEIAINTNILHEPRHQAHSYVGIAVLKSEKNVDSNCHMFKNNVTIVCLFVYK